MNALKTSLVLLLLVPVVFISDAQESESLYTISEEKIDIKFTIAYTFDDLVELKQNLKKADIDIEYELLQFDDHGHLIKISTSINYNDGFKGSIESRLLQPTDKPGFYRDFSVIPRGKK